MPRKRTSLAKRRRTIIVTCDKHSNPSRAARFRKDDDTWTPVQAGDRPSNIERPSGYGFKVLCSTRWCGRYLVIADDELADVLDYLHSQHVNTVTMSDALRTMHALQRQRPGAHDRDSNPVRLERHDRQHH